MKTFDIQEEFLLNGEPFKILSGAIHYFRVHPDDWYHSLYNLKALGFNTVETYMPWNLHEKQQGEFDFEGICDIEGFLKMAHELELLVILRPSPYICSEWEFGGLPAWLLNKDCRIRSSDPAFLKYVERYYHELFLRVSPYQITEGGPIIMMQVENEYGSYGEDKDYLAKMTELMKANGVTVPLVTSDGSWQATLRAGSVVDLDILPTGNFGSRGKENFKELQAFHESHGKKWPLMCMEFWDGWFNRWGEPIVTRETDELIEAIREVLELGSINLYMFHGGTNFGFMNGCSARGTIDLPQITSYDYGAPLDEQGNPTEKYYGIKALIAEMFPNLEQKDPLIKKTMEITDIALTGKVGLFASLEDISVKHESKYPQSMEYFNQYYGYMLYRTRLEKDMPEEKYRVIDGRDRMQMYLNEKYVTTQYQEEIGADIFVTPEAETNQLDILMENMGRVNYGHKLLADTQRKGIRMGVMADLHFMLDWEQYSINFEQVDKLDFSKEWQASQPAFYRYEFEVRENVEDTFIDLSQFGKGICLINGVNIGRFWNKGPLQTLYIPRGYLLEGHNEIIIFETEGSYGKEINLTKEPINQLNV